MITSRAKPKESVSPPGQQQPPVRGPKFCWPKLKYHWNKTDERILDAIRSYVARWGYAPTRREISKVVRLSVTGTQKHLDAMIGTGLLTAVPGSARTLRINEDRVVRAQAACTIHATVLGDSLGVPGKITTAVDTWIETGK